LVGVKITIDEIIVCHVPVSVLTTMMKDKLYLIIDVDNKYTIYNSQEKPVSATIYTVLIV
jgi:hypothetical protein